MTRRTTVGHEFVQLVPREMKQGMVYVSIEYATAVHLCVCGCGNKVVTPITPTDWKLIFDGETISLDPSIGNWSFKCRSHYWIEQNRVEWAPDWSKEKITTGRDRDRWAKERYFNPARRAPPGPGQATEPERRRETKGFLTRLTKLFRP